MSFSSNRGALLVVGALLATSACGGNGAVPVNAGAGNPAPQLSVSTNTNAQVAAVDNTSILKKLKKDVVIGSTVDPTNGDTGPRSLARVAFSFGKLKKGQLVYCNFADSTGTAGNGTTIDLINPKPTSSPATFIQDTKIKGCDGNAISAGNYTYAGGMTSGIAVAYDQNGKYKKTYGPPIQQPLNVDDANCGQPYAPESIYVADAKTGAITKFSIGLYGNPKEVQVISGFGINSGSGWTALGPSGIQYDGRMHGSRCNDSLYVVDGVDNTVIAVSNAANLLVKDEIVVKPGGKTFKCKDPRATCAKLVYSGAPLNGPLATAFLPNGNLIVANTKGGNKLVEITTATPGKVLATKSIDKSTIAHVFGLLAVGTNDTNTVLYYTDTKDNTLHELEP
jgi:hypothetical protein